MTAELRETPKRRMRDIQKEFLEFCLKVNPKITVGEAGILWQLTRKFK